MTKSTKTATMTKVSPHGLTDGAAGVVFSGSKKREKRHARRHRGGFRAG